MECYLPFAYRPQGNDTDMLLSNIGLKFSINKRGIADLLFQNVFDDTRQRITTQGNNFFSSAEYSKYDRLIQLTFGYRFNEAKKSAKNIKTEYGERDF